MAGGVVRSLVTRILFKSDATGLKKVETNTRAAKREMRAASRAAFTLKRDLKGMMIGMQGLIGIVIAGRIGKMLTVDFATAADEAAKFSKATGVSVETYQGLTHAASLSGASINDLQKGLMQAGKRARDAAVGTKKTVDAFKELGVSVKNSDGSLKNQDQILLETADRFKSMKDGSSKTALAMELFGKSGAKLIPMFNEGADGIKKMMLEAKQLGIILTKDQAAVAENFNDEMLRAKSVLIGVRNQIAVRLLPAITRNMRAFQRWAREGDNLQRALDRLALAGKVLVVVFALVAGAKIGQSLQLLTSITKRAVFWTKALGKAQLLAYAKFILVGAAIAGIVLVIQSLIVWSRGGKSAVGDLLERFNLADGARRAMEAVGNAGRALVPIAKAAGRAWLAWLGALQQVAQALWREFGPSLEALGVALVELFRELWPVLVDGAAALKVAMLELTAIMGKAWREDVAPALREVGKAMGDLWVVAQPIVKQLWAAAKVWAGILYTVAKEVLPALAKSASLVFRGIAEAIKFSITQLTVLIKFITFIVDKLRKAYNLLLAVTGFTKQGTGLSVGLGAGAATGLKHIAPRAPGAGAPGNVQQTLSIGTVSVSVGGTANMTPDELAAATELGAGRALQRKITDAFTNVRAVVPVPG